MASNEEKSVSEQNGKKEAVTGSREQRENPAEQIPAGQSLAGENNTEPSQNGSSKAKEAYAKNYLRISKDNLYMVIALWMEDFVDEAPEHLKKVGAVLVLPNDIIYAADCSRDGVHAVQRLLMKHYDKAEGCKMFMSRKPCPMCAKLLVQAKVQRVLFLPLEPEYHPSPDKDSKVKQVDILFTASAIAQTKFVLQIDQSVLVRAKNQTPQKDRQKVEKEKRRLIDEKYSAFKKDSKWLDLIEKEIPWAAFDEIKADFQNYFEEVMEWIARVFYIPQSQSQPDKARGVNYPFELCEPSNEPRSDVSNPVSETSTAPSDVFDPVSNATHKKQAKCLIEIARFLATRTDDPITGVGAVIASPKMEILGLGWNGFPLKAHYGEFARASDPKKPQVDKKAHDELAKASDQNKPQVDKKAHGELAITSDQNKPQVDKKYPYVIHAEQNALLMRNKKDIEGAILFVTKSPCHECTPLIAMQGIKTVVVDEDVFSHDETAAKKKTLNYKMFPGMVKNRQFVCYQTKKEPIDAKDIAASEETTREMIYVSDN